MKHFIKTAAVVMMAVTVCLLSSCTSKETPKHVVFIGLDGWGAYSMPKADMPVVKNMMENGAWTLKKRAVLPSSSAINWASIFMGVGTEGHGYTTWGSKTPEIPSIATSKNGIFPTLFTIVREQMPEAETGAIYEWDGVSHLIDTLSINYYKTIPPQTENNSQPITDAAVSYIESSKPTLLAVVYDNPDHVGHAAGHDTQEYYDILNYLDSQISQIVEATKRAGIYDETLFVITADHGGIEKGHGGKTLQEMETPLIFFGPGVKNTGELESAIMQFDIAPTIAELLGVTPPQPWVGRPVVEAIK